jgi:hypothetical protein
MFCIQPAEPFRVLDKSERITNTAPMLGRISREAEYLEVSTGVCQKSGDRWESDANRADELEERARACDSPFLRHFSNYVQEKPGWPMKCSSLSVTTIS